MRPTVLGVEQAWDRADIHHIWRIALLTRDVLGPATTKRRLLGSHRVLEEAGVILAILQRLVDGGFELGKRARLPFELALAALGQVRHPPR